MSLLFLKVILAFNNKQYAALGFRYTKEVFCKSDYSQCEGT